MGGGGRCAPGLGEHAAAVEKAQHALLELDGHVCRRQRSDVEPHELDA